MNKDNINITETINSLKKEIDRLNEYVQNLEMIESQHQEMNGKLHKELAAMKIANKKLEDKILEFIRPTKKRYDDI